MKILFVLLITQLSFSQNITEKQIERLKKIKDLTYEDLAHENPGCPENSSCSEEMGRITGIFTDILKSKNNTNKLKKFFDKYGLPLNHFTRNTDKDTIFFSSRCRQHNPKEGEKTVEAFRYLKVLKMTTEQIFEKVDILDDDLSYYIPLRDTPYFIKNGKLVILKEFEDLSYYLSISSNGKITPIKPSKDDLKTAFKYSENILECPENKDLNNYFLGSYCRQIYNFDKKKVQVARIDWACP